VGVGVCSVGVEVGVGVGDGQFISNVVAVKQSTQLSLSSPILSIPTSLLVVYSINVAQPKNPSEVSTK